MSFGRNLSNKYRKRLLNTATKTGLDALKIASKNVAHKEAETMVECIGNKIPNEIVKLKPVPEKIIITPEQREDILNELRPVL